MIARIPALAAGLALLTAVALAGCGRTTARDFPTLVPLEGLLAQADSAFSRPRGQ